MKTLTPWKRAGSSAPAEARLLDGRRIPSRMPDEARERLAARLFGPASLAARPAPESTRPSTASGLRPKPIIAAIIAVGFGFTAFVTERAVPPPSAPTSPHFATTPAASATAHTAHEEEPSPLPVFSIDEIPNVPPPRPPPTPKVVDAPDTLLREIALVDDARSKLTTDPARALEILEQHRREHGRGQLALERDVLRLEALVGLGRRDEAERIGQSIQSRAKGTPYAGRATSVLARTRGPQPDAFPTTR